MEHFRFSHETASSYSWITVRAKEKNTMEQKAAVIYY